MQYNNLCHSTRELSPFMYVVINNFSTILLCGLYLSHCFILRPLLGIILLNIVSPDFHFWCFVFLFSLRFLSVSYLFFLDISWRNAFRNRVRFIAPKRMYVWYCQSIVATTHLWLFSTKLWNILDYTIRMNSSCKTL